jgi:hypothetical protein
VQRYETFPPLLLAYAFVMMTFQRIAIAAVYHARYLCAVRTVGSDSFQVKRHFLERACFIRIEAFHVYFDAATLGRVAAPGLSETGEHMSSRCQSTFATACGQTASYAS